MRPQQPETDRLAPRWAVPSGSATPVSASDDTELSAQFDARVRHLFASLDAAIAAPTAVTIDALRDALHKVAGTAAFFGKAALGQTAADLDDQLGNPACVTPAFLHTARATLGRALGHD